MTDKTIVPNGNPVTDEGVRLNAATVTNRDPSGDFDKSTHHAVLTDDAFIKIHKIPDHCPSANLDLSADNVLIHEGEQLGRFHLNHTDSDS